MNEMTTKLYYVLIIVWVFALGSVGCRPTVNSAQEPPGHARGEIEIAAKVVARNGVQSFVGPIRVSSPTKPTLYFSIAESEFGPIPKMIPFVVVVDLNKADLVSRMYCFTFQGPDLNTMVEVWDPALVWDRMDLDKMLAPSLPDGRPEIEATHSFTVLPGGGFIEEMDFAYQGFLHPSLEYFDPSKGRVFVVNIDQQNKTMVVRQFALELFSTEGLLEKLDVNDDIQTTDWIYQWWDSSSPEKQRIETLKFPGCELNALSDQM